MTWWLLALPVGALGLFLAAARVGSQGEPCRGCGAANPPPPACCPRLPCSRADTPPPTSINQARASGLFPALNTEED